MLQASGANRQTVAKYKSLHVRWQVLLIRALVDVPFLDDPVEVEASCEALHASWQGRHVHALVKVEAEATCEAP